ncbi:unnamed protein product [Dibothriocephalus latus]|uniref:Uncharacterized protein n=1 Tax=Dibothriocephalus latus TaxID=60516 RepID=A0A3P7L4B6_DIBLA|nr:unnamed protein product [Dibothriocephalus latus]
MMGNGFIHQEGQTSAFVVTAVATDDRVVGTERDLGGVTPLRLPDSHYSYAVRKQECEEPAKIAELAVSVER